MKTDVNTSIYAYKYKEQYHQGYICTCICVYVFLCACVFAYRLCLYYCTGIIRYHASIGGAWSANKDNVRTWC